MGCQVILYAAVEGIASSPSCRACCDISNNCLGPRRSYGSVNSKMPSCLLRLCLFPSLVAAIVLPPPGSSHRVLLAGPRLTRLSLLSPSLLRNPLLSLSPQGAPPPAGFPVQRVRLPSQTTRVNTGTMEKLKEVSWRMGEADAM